LKTTGQTIRNHRESKKLLLRQVAAAIDLDPALLSKFERDTRKPSKDQLYLIASYYNINVDELILAWLSDKIVEVLKNEPLARQALKLAESKIEINKKKVK